MIEQLLAVSGGKPYVIPAAPGPSTLSKGDVNLGYFGTLTGTAFMDRATLKSLVGITTGTDTTFWDGNWIKIIIDRKVQFIPSRGLVNGLNHNALDALGIVQGKVITWNGYKFKVRLANISKVDDYPITQNVIDINTVPEASASEWARTVNALITPSLGLSGPAWGLFPQASTLVPTGTYTMARQYRRGATTTAVFINNTQISFSSFTDTGGTWLPILEIVA